MNKARKTKEFVKIYGLSRVLNLYKYNYIGWCFYNPSSLSWVKKIFDEQLLILKANQNLKLISVKNSFVAKLLGNNNNKLLKNVNYLIAAKDLNTVLALPIKNLSENKFTIFLWNLKNLVVSSSVIGKLKVLLKSNLIILNKIIKTIYLNLILIIKILNKRCLHSIN